VAPVVSAAGRTWRVTDERDGIIVPRQMSYWANAWASGNTAFVFAGTSEGVRFFSVDLETGAVERMPIVFPYGGETEGWSWTRDGEIFLYEGPRLRCVSPFSGDDRVLLDISDRFPGCDLWQPHASNDGQTLSATVRRIVDEGAYPKIGTVVLAGGQQHYFGASGVLDESAVTADGAFVVIKEDEDNIVVDLATGEIRFLPDAGGAVGHSDVGPSYVVGEANLPGPGACVYWDLRLPLELRYRRTLFLTDNMGYVSCRGDVWLHSGPADVSLVSVDGSGLVPLFAHGNVGTAYSDRVKANLSPCARVACYMTNAGGPREDVYVFVLP
jgi:hypothetical protein